MKKWDKVIYKGEEYFIFCVYGAGYCEIRKADCMGDYIVIDHSGMEIVHITEITLADVQ